MSKSDNDFPAIGAPSGLSKGVASTWKLSAFTDNRVVISESGAELNPCFGVNNKYWVAKYKYRLQENDGGSFERSLINPVGQYFNPSFPIKQLMMNIEKEESKEEEEEEEEEEKKKKKDI